MALDPLPDEIIVRNRDEFLEGFLSAYRTKDPTANTNEGSFPHIIGAALADQLVVLSQDARIIGRSIPLSEVVGLRLDQRLAELGLPARFQETGSSGFVQITASGGGATLTPGQTLTEENSQAQFEFTGEGGTYSDGASVPIRAITTGPATNFAAGTELKWDSPSAGLGPVATVQEPGLTGGRVAESDDQVRLRISEAYADPAAAGNVATYIRLAENSGAHGVPVQKAFAYPAINGPGTIGIAFVLTSGGPGTSRIPSPQQIALVRNYILTVPDDPTRIPPGDDGLLDTTLISQPVPIVIDVRWSRSGSNWKEAVPWPPRRETGEGAIVVSAVTSATQFTLARDDADYDAEEPQPTVGQTIAFYDKSNARFARKRILSFTGTGPWVITVDTTHDASDTNYVPVEGQRACPWSESLDDLVEPILNYFDTLGPGEQRAKFFDPGVREKRFPPSPESWPSVITSHLATAILDVPAVADAVIREGLGEHANVGTPGVSAYLLELGDIAAFPLI